VQNNEFFTASERRGSHIEKWLHGKVPIKPLTRFLFFRAE